MLPKKNLRSKVKEIKQLQARLGEKQKAYQGILQEIQEQYKRKARQSSDEEFDEVSLAGLRKQSEDLAYEASGIEAAFLACEREALELAKKELDSIPQQIEKLEATRLQQREKLLCELLSTLEKALELQWRLTGRHHLISQMGVIDLPPMPGSMVREANGRLRSLFDRGQLDKDDPYSIENQIKELKSKLLAGPQALVNEALAESA
jgi:DNA repair exonuclease SbcCD ATPase subunit